MWRFEKLKQIILRILREGLPDYLSYHGVHHTLDVLEVCEEYIEREGLEGEDACLLKVGALMHDIGFTESFENHEATGARIAEKILPDFDFTQDQIAVVKGLIMATKVPQRPKNILEKIICDADLDYLGRDDFYPISSTLFDELKAISKIKSESDWNRLQILFLESHHYHTDFAIKNRQPEKEKRLNELRELVKQ